MKQPRRPDPPPMQTKDMLTVQVGTAIWAIALVVLLIAQPPEGRHWWIWTCVAGVVGGFFGMAYIWRRNRRSR
ncbi:DUF2530 domain-containing protein [Bailinhaonella thermotolerans]|uniref:DUF2530 domain-containing protein n=1 Tax=Bailinhaonella thermotolerans TaxID=1070861 RepID=A0A3A4BPT6_9ACTN|nr:DUF2530 domain-containing protein [Bailinhaonella thermotolerans]RJL33156.1 DUF2530 domain-containing protein [Bailinhaonella thermotolerans]